MPLQIKLPMGERIVVNGAVIESANESASLIFHNRVDILRRKEIMTEEEATTPASLMYYNIQCAYLFKPERKKFVENYLSLRDQYLSAAPSAQELCDEADEMIEQEEFYSVLRIMQRLLDHESERLKQVMG